MHRSPISALAAHQQPRPRLPFAEARQGNNIVPQVHHLHKPQPAPQAQEQLEMQQAAKQKQLPEHKKDKARPPSPPAIIRNEKETLVFSKIGFLGEGGFARVYEAKDARNVRHAIKVINKNALKTTKNRTKLFAEIKIHKSLHHPNIVTFEECFEDEENVYMVLELCEGGSLVDLIRRRKRLTEPEARVLLIQLIGASEWMHTHQVIHRDLKLGNIFLDDEMNVKVGDFGLAALIENPGDRKKTVCGTPNYIAPEVLFDPGNGHSFEVDIWSIGVILYTLVVGKPPFQNKEIKAIYKRIRDNLYEFPAEINISNDCKSLISAMLTKDPAQRPTLREVLEHPFFTEGLMPASIPPSAHDLVPSWANLTPAESRENLLKMREAARLEEQPETEEDELESSEEPASASSANVAPTVAQQERDFQHAVQPGSPISVLLQSAQQPLLVAPRDNESLIKRLTASRERETGALLSAKRANAGLRPIQENPRTKPSTTIKTQAKDSERVTTVENQKARIVAQMAATLPSASPDPTDELKKSKQVKKSVQSSTTSRLATNGSGLKQSVAGPGQAVRLNAFSATELTLVAAAESMTRGTVFSEPQEPIKLPALPNFLICWVDYTSKYGMGYAMNDGTVASHFNDSTSLILSPDEKHLEYIDRKSGSTFVRKAYDPVTPPKELGDKPRLLGHFATYLMQKLYGDHEYTFVDRKRTSGMDFVVKYLRLKHGILFRLSNNVLQFNFYDHTKLLLSHRGHVVTHISKDDVLKQYLLADIVGDRFATEDKKTRDKLVARLEHIRGVLRAIRKGEVVEVKPATNASTPAENLESEAPEKAASEAAHEMRMEDIGRKRGTLLSASAKMIGGQIR